jgi:peptidyl-tRNA hydrolase
LGQKSQPFISKSLGWAKAYMFKLGYPKHVNKAGDKKHVIKAGDKKQVIKIQSTAEQLGFTVRWVKRGSWTN